MEQPKEKNPTPTDLLVTNPVKFCGNVIKTTATADPSVAEAWMARTPHAHQVANIAVAWQRNPSPSAKIVTLQLYFGKRCLILQLSQMERVTERMRDFFSSSMVRFHGVGVDDGHIDFSPASGDGGIDMSHVLDLRPDCDLLLRIARICSLSSTEGEIYYRKKLRVQDYAKVILNVHLRMPKHVKESDWEAKELTVGQVQYACRKVFVVHMLYKATK